MELVYMNKLQIHVERRDIATPLELSEIVKLENDHSINFPKAYREFLILAGIYCPLVKIGTYQFENMFVRQSRAQELLKKYKLSHLIQKKFWVVGDFDDAFWYFHFDEGDNPKIYRLDCESYGEMDDEYTFGEVADSFSAWIDKAIGVWEFEQTLEDI